MPVTLIFTMAAMCQEYISLKGYELNDEVITSTLAEEVEAMAERAPITPILSPSQNDFTSRNSFWLTLRHRGELVGTLGARFDDVADCGIGEHLSNLHNRHYPSLGGSRVVSNMGAHGADITGGVVYMGDVFFLRKHRGDIAKTQCFCQYAYCLAYSRWWERANWIVALHRKRDALAGKVSQYGFTSRCFPAVQKWIDAPDGRSSNEHLSALSKPDFLRNIETFIADPESLVCPPTRPRLPNGS